MSVFTIDLHPWAALHGLLFARHGSRSLPAAGTAPVELRRHAVHRLDATVGMQLRCTTGALWITHDGDPKDIVLAAGETSPLREGRRVLVQALEPSSCLVVAPRRDEPPRALRFR
jgi:hypothetical protein